MRMFWIGLALLMVMGCGEGPDARKQKFLLKANEMIENRNYDKASYYLQEALRLDSCFADAWNNLGVIATQKGDQAGALTCYSQAVACKTDHLDALLNKATALYELGDARGVLREVRRIRSLKPDTAVAYFLEGLAYTNEGSFDSAAYAFEQAEAPSPGNLEVTLNLGTVFYFQGKYELAQERLTEVLAKKPDNANALNVLALIACAKGRYQEALARSQKAVAIAPSDPWLLNNRGYIYLLMGDGPRALADIDKSILLDPSNGWAYRNKGLYFYMQQDYPSAIRLYERARKEEGYVENLGLYLGDAYYAAGNKTKACETWAEEAMNHEAQQRLLKCR